MRPKYRKNKKPSIGVSVLSRYWANPDDFERFIKATPNKYAIQQGDRFHNTGVFHACSKLIKTLILILGVAYAGYLAYSNLSLY